MEYDQPPTWCQRLRKMLLCCTSTVAQLRCCTNTKRKAVLKATCDDTCCCHGKQSLVIAYDEKSSDSDSTDISIGDDKVKVS